MKNIMIILAIISIFFLAVMVGSDRQQVKDCYTWKSWADQSNLFKPSHEMLATCEKLGVKVK